MKKQQMKLESLSGSKFGTMTNEQMSMIVGAGDCTTGHGTATFDGHSYSNDWIDCNGKPAISANGSDFTASQLQTLSQVTCK